MQVEKKCRLGGGREREIPLVGRAVTVGRLCAAGLRSCCSETTATAVVVTRRYNIADDGGGDRLMMAGWSGVCVMRATVMRYETRLTVARGGSAGVRVHGRGETLGRRRG